MKRLFILLLLPLIVAVTCEEDDLTSGFETEYILQNDSSLDLIFFPEGSSKFTVESKSSLTIAIDLNQETNPITPSETFTFSSIELYKSENNNFIQVYKQDPVDDNTWVLNEPTENRFEYKLIITDELLK